MQSLIPENDKTQQVNSAYFW